MKELKRVDYIVSKGCNKNIGEYLDSVVVKLNLKKRAVYIASVYDSRSKISFIVYSDEAKALFGADNNYEVTK